MRLTKNAKYKDNTNKYGTLTYTGKKKKINYGMGDYYTAHSFDYTDDNFPEEFGTQKKWIAEYQFESRLTAL
jgi:hypothetical protein